MAISVRTLSLDLDINQGSYLKVPCYYPSFEGGELVLTNITNATITCKLRETLITPALISLTTPSSVVITDAVNGKFDLIFDVASTASLPKENMVLRGNVEVTLSGGQTIRTHNIVAYFSPDYNY